MYETTKKELYCLPMANEAYTTVKDFCKCTTINHGTKTRITPLQNIRASDPLKFGTMDIRKPQFKTLQGNKFVFVMPDCSFKLKIAILTLKMIALHVTSSFMYFWIKSYRITTYLLTGNGTQLLSKLLEMLCAFSETRPLMTTAYHSQKINLEHRFNKRTITRLQNDVAVIQHALEFSVLPLAYGSLAGGHCSKN